MPSYRQEKELWPFYCGCLRSSNFSVSGEFVGPRVAVWSFVLQPRTPQLLLKGGDAGDGEHSKWVWPPCLYRVKPPTGVFCHWIIKWRFYQQANTGGSIHIFRRWRDPTYFHTDFFLALWNNCSLFQCSIWVTVLCSFLVLHLNSSSNRKKGSQQVILCVRPLVATWRASNTAGPAALQRPQYVSRSSVSWLSL